MEILQSVIVNQKTKRDFQFNASFGPYVKFLKNRMASSSGMRAKFYSYLVHKFEKYPELLVPFRHEILNASHRELLNLVQMSVLPLTSVLDDSPLALAFMQPETFVHYTDSFKKLVVDEKIDFATSKDEYNLLRYFQKHILERYYKRWPDNVQHFFKKAYNAELNTTRHFKIKIDSRFTEVSVSGQLPDYKPDWHELLYLPEAEYFASLGQFPFASFCIEGFLVLQVEDVSEQAAINQLNNAIVNMHSFGIEATLKKVQESMGELLHDSKIKMGITPFFSLNDEVVYDETFTSKPILLHLNGEDVKNRISRKDVVELFAGGHRPFIYSKVDAHLRKHHPFLNGLEEQGINSYMAFPIKTREALLGIFELASSEAGIITEASIEHIQLAFPIIADVFHFMIRLFNSRIEKVVKEKFTSLQPSVEWKFNKVAWEYIKTISDQHPGQLDNIVFKEVHPLYGSVDIRNSSVERNSACMLDCQAQLTCTAELLREIAGKISLPLLEGLEYKCKTFLSRITNELSVENELKVNDFFHAELEPLLHYLTQRHPQVEIPVNNYFDSTEMETGFFHKQRRAYQQSVQLLNDNMVLFFENEVHKLQELYPFYFEKFRTDGLEYNIYIGPSIVPGQPYNSIHLKNLRLWQITSMAQVAILNHQLEKHLPIPLQTTQIILVYSTPIDISFRKDERRFDVEGSYNIKYEVIKKRIDKAKIQDTMERLSKPDCIAIVFNNQKDMDAYREHIEFLQDKGVLKNEVENLVLEDLQGISGLMAIRLGINYPVSNEA